MEWNQMAVLTTSGMPLLIVASGAEWAACSFVVHVKFMKSLQPFLCLSGRTSGCMASIVKFIKVLKLWMRWSHTQLHRRPVHCNCDFLVRSVNHVFDCAVVVTSLPALVRHFVRPVSSSPVPGNELCVASFQEFENETTILLLPASRVTSLWVVFHLLISIRWQSRR